MSLFLCDTASFIHSEIDTNLSTVNFCRSCTPETLLAAAEACDGILRESVPCRSGKPCFGHVIAEVPLIGL